MNIPFCLRFRFVSPDDPRATQTADIIAEALMVPRVRVEPEFRWLEGRGYGVLDGGYLQLARARMRALDLQDSASAAPEAEDGTPSDSVEDVFVRLRNTVLKIENTYSGTDVVIVGGDSTVLSAVPLPQPAAHPLAAAHASAVAPAALLDPLRPLALNGQRVARRMALIGSPRQPTPQHRLREHMWQPAMQLLAGIAC